LVCQYSHRTTTSAVHSSYGAIFPAAPHAYGRDVRSQEAVFHVVPFSKCMFALPAERFLSGTPMHLFLVDAPNRAISMDEISHAGLEPFRTFVCSNPMDGILQAFGQRCRPMDGILSDTLRALMDQTQFCCKKLHSSQHHLCFRAMINIQPRIRRLRCYSSRANGTPVALAADSKRHVLLSTRV